MSSPERSTVQPRQGGSSDHGKPSEAPGVTAAAPDQPAESSTSEPLETSNSGDLIALAEDRPKTGAAGEAGEGDVAEAALRGEEPPTSPPEMASHDGQDPMDHMASSIATLKPTTAATTTATQYLTIGASSYVDPTPQTPVSSHPPSRSPSSSPRRNKHSDPSPTRSDATADEKPYTSEDDQESGSRSELQSIMEQFSEAGGGPGAEEVMSPRLGLTSPTMLASPVQHPPRKSSLEPLAPSIAQQLQDMHISGSLPPSVQPREKERDEDAPPVPPKDGSTPSIRTIRSRDELQGVTESPLSPTMSLHRPPPPEPEPEPALPFDFHRFLEQLRHKKADPVARYLKSFLQEFGKRQWMVHEQVKIISDFLAFIANKMAQCDVWRDVSDAEFDNAREGMEKLVMNRLYTQTFSPAIPPPQPIPGGAAKGKKRGERPMGPGRRGQHQEDVERDEILAQKIQIYSWTKEEHLDIPPVSESGKRFLKLAQDELLKIKSYRAPRDKIICVLNCCKVIFGLLKHSKSDGSADSFMPMLIYVVLHANPEHLVSNVQYVLRFRNQEKLGGEAGYYLSSLMGAIQFIENMDRTTLTITDEEFEANVEAAVSAIAEKHRAESPPLPPSQSEKSALLQPPGGGKQASSSSSTRPSLDVDATLRPSTPRRSTSSNEGARDSGGEYSGGEEKAAITGLLRTIQKPLSSIGRIFSDEGGGGPSSTESAPPPPGPASTPRPERGDGDVASRQQLSAEEAAARQASAEVAEAQRLHRAEHANIVETLAGMFPDLDREIISDVVYQKEGRVGLAVDACLALSA